jgi:hypothetical protein
MQQLIDSIFTLKTYFSINILQNPEKNSKYDILFWQSDHYIEEKYVFFKELIHRSSKQKISLVLRKSICLVYP